MSQPRISSCVRAHAPNQRGVTIRLGLDLGDQALVAPDGRAPRGDPEPVSVLRLLVEGLALQP
jgi:hypothetical protein